MTSLPRRTRKIETPTANATNSDNALVATPILTVGEDIIDDGVTSAEAAAIAAATVEGDDQEDETGKDESEDDDAPAQPEANSTAQLVMPLASIDVDQQGDVPLELGNVEARAKKPDGSTVVVTTKGKYRQAAPGEQWIDTILQSE